MSWQAWTGWYVGFSCSMAQVAVHIFLQSTVLLGLGLVAGRLLRRRGAATQSVAYRTTLLAILLCPGVCCFFAAAGVEGVALPWPGSFDTGRPLGIGSSLPTARTAAPTAFATTQPRYEAGPDRGSLESSRRPIPVTVGHQPDAALSGSVRLCRGGMRRLRGPFRRRPRTVRPAAGECGPALSAALGRSECGFAQVAPRAASCADSGLFPAAVLVNGTPERVIVLRARPHSPAPRWLLRRRLSRYRSSKASVRSRVRRFPPVVPPTREESNPVPLPDIPRHAVVEAMRKS